MQKTRRRWCVKKFVVAENSPTLELIPRENSPPMVCKTLVCEKFVCSHTPKKFLSAGGVMIKTLSKNKKMIHSPNWSAWRARGDLCSRARRCQRAERFSGMEHLLSDLEALTDTPERQEAVALLVKMYFSVIHLYKLNLSTPVSIVVYSCISISCGVTQSAVTLCHRTPSEVIRIPRTERI